MSYECTADVVGRSEQDRLRPGPVRASLNTTPAPRNGSSPWLMLFPLGAAAASRPLFCCGGRPCARLAATSCGIRKYVMFARMPARGPTA